MGKAVASSYSPHQKFLDTGIINKTFQQSQKQDSFREILTGSAKFYRSSSSQFFRTTNGIQAFPDALRK